MTFLARLICSDVDCAEEVALAFEESAELAVASCDCGCTLELLAVSLDAWEPDPAWRARLRACRPLVAS